MIIIREATLSDVAAIKSIEDESYPFPWSEKVLQDCFGKNYSSWVAEQSDQIVGYLIVTEIVGEIHLLNVCVSPSVRRLGVAKQLLGYLISWASKHSMHSILLEVRESNIAAQSLYVDLRFQLIGRRPNYYPSDEGREDALMFSLDLLRTGVDCQV
jgi:ribosomal-protein-alanine N-acetyltransferase